MKILDQNHRVANFMRHRALRRVTYWDYIEKGERTIIDKYKEVKNEDASSIEEEAFMNEKELALYNRKKLIRQKKIHQERLVLHGVMNIAQVNEKENNA